MAYSNLLSGATTNAPITTKTREDQIKNDAGGYVFQANDWTRLERFLILGTMDDTYYADKNRLVRENVGVLVSCIQSDGKKFVDVVTDISFSGRAPKNDPAIFALALAVAQGTPDVKNYALSQIEKVCRTGTHFFTFLSELKGLNVKWGRSVTRNVANWYLNKSADQLALQLVKYRQRNGWTHTDAMRLSHPAFAKQDDLAKRALVEHFMDGKFSEVSVPDVYIGFLNVQQPSIPIEEALKEIERCKLPWEALPTEMLNNVKVWETLLPNMGYTALLRNLGKLTNIGLLESSQWKSFVAEKLVNGIPQNRVHPMQILVALKTYSMGKGFKGSLTWSPEGRISSSLNDAFYASFGKLDRNGKARKVAVDVSGSMSGTRCFNGLFQLHEAAACMAMVDVHCAPDSQVIGVDGAIHEFDIHGRRLDDVMRLFGSINGGTTHLQLVPLHKIKDTPDMTVIYTDNVSWTGGHVFEAWNRAKQINPNARLANITMVPNQYQLTPADDGSVIQIAGFDASIPQILSAFAGSSTTSEPEEATEEE